MKKNKPTQQNSLINFGTALPKLINKNLKVKTMMTPKKKQQLILNNNNNYFLSRVIVS